MLNSNQIAISAVVKKRSIMGRKSSVLSGTAEKLNHVLIVGELYMRNILDRKSFNAIFFWHETVEKIMINNTYTAM